MKFLFWLILICFLMILPVSAQNTEGIMERHTLTHSNHQRTYLVYTPADYDTSKSYSLLLALHPASTTGQEMADMTRFEQLADTHDVLMVFPDSVGGRWNSSGATTPDDGGFFSVLLDKLIADYAIDESQVFVLGYSSGGLMTLKLRCVLADRIQGIISYAAPLTFQIANDCLSVGSVSALVIHGTKDEVFPYGGQASVSDGVLAGTFSAEQTIGVLASLNGCGSRPQTADISADGAGSPVYVTRYPCNNDLVTELYTIANMGHFNWAGQLAVKLEDELLTLNDVIFRFIKTAGGQQS